MTSFRINILPFDVALNAEDFWSVLLVVLLNTLVTNIAALETITSTSAETEVLKSSKNKTKT